MWNRLCFCLLLFSNQVFAQESEPPSREETYKRYRDGSYVFSFVNGYWVRPTWMEDGSTFSFRDDSVDPPVFYRVDPIANSQEPVFDVARLRNALAKQLAHEPKRLGIPFDTFAFVNLEKAVRFTTEGKAFILQLDSYEISPACDLPRTARPKRSPQPGLLNSPETGYRGREILSPDGNWFATLKDYNVWLRSTTDGTMVQLTTDGTAGDAYALWPDYVTGESRLARFAEWSPDSTKLVVEKIKPGKSAKHPLIDWQDPSGNVDWFLRPRADGALVQTELILIDVRTKQRLRVDSNEPDQILILTAGWLPDSSAFLLRRCPRSYRRQELIAVDATSGSTRLIISDDPGGWGLTVLRRGQQFLWKSFRDGWNHLYLYDIQGTLLRQLTQGPWPVQDVIKVDEQLGWVYFTAHSDVSRPYDLHLCRVDLEGANFKQLTEETGVHFVQISPSKRFFLDIHSTPSRPPTVVLRATDGKLIRTLFESNIGGLIQSGWQPPEEFVVKAADGKTDLYGLLWKPDDFDPQRKYPVLEDIYGLLIPSVSYKWGIDMRSRAMAQLGFVVFSVDSRGTKGRSREFLREGLDGRFLIPDHVATLKQLAATRPYMDLNRVGIHGHSFGGYSTLRALLTAPNVFHVGVASSPLVDMHDLNFFNAYVGLYEQNKAAFDAAANSQIAGNLKGKLLIIQGARDLVTPMRYTMNLINAFAKAGKHYDLIILPEAGHELSAIQDGARRQYFQEHLRPVPAAETVHPLAGESYFDASVLLHAVASPSAESRIDRVELLIDGRIVFTDNEPPYKTEWEWSRKGEHQFAVRVHDSTGRTEDSPQTMFYTGVHGLERTVASSTDDVEEQEDGTMSTDSYDLQLTRDDSGGARTIGLRFMDISIRKGAKISRAYLQFNVESAENVSTNLIIRAHLLPNSPTFSRQNKDLSSRPATDGSVAWSPMPRTQTEAVFRKRRTPDLSQLIQRIVTQDDWKEGNALAFVISGAGLQRAVAFDSAAKYAPMHHIEYEP